MKSKLMIVLLLLAVITLAACGSLRDVTQKTPGTEAESDTLREREDEGLGDNGYLDYVEIGGVKCTKKQNVLTYLIIGEDSDRAGQCDFLRVLVLDKQANTYAVIPINRNTMTEVRSYAEDTGEDLGTSICEICLAHATGSGSLSCENTVEAVSNLLCGQKIDGYYCLNMGAVQIMNDMVGGVTVEIDEDLTPADPAFVEGATVTLTGEQALSYVRARMLVGDGTNEARMKRQQIFLNAFEEKAMERCQASNDFAVEMYDALDEYASTNITRRDVSKMVNSYMKYTNLGIYEIEGQKGSDDWGFDTFTPEQSSLETIVRDLFYNICE